MYRASHEHGHIDICNRRCLAMTQLDTLPFALLNDGLWCPRRLSFMTRKPSANPIMIPYSTFRERATHLSLPVSKQQSSKRPSEQDGRLLSPLSSSVDIVLWRARLVCHCMFVDTDTCCPYSQRRGEQDMPTATNSKFELEVRLSLYSIVFQFVCIAILILIGLAYQHMADVEERQAGYYFSPRSGTATADFKSPRSTQ